jgi:hypothetical protein
VNPQSVYSAGMNLQEDAFVQMSLVSWTVPLTQGLGLALFGSYTVVLHHVVALFF